MKAIATILVLVMATSFAVAQNLDGKGVIGLYGGANMWFTDLYKTKVGAGDRPVQEVVLKKVTATGA